MDDDAARRRARMVAQLAATWTIGAFGLPAAAGVVALAAYTGGSGGPMVAGPLAAGVLGILLWLTISGTATASVLGGTIPMRVLWVLLVLGPGTVLWGFGWALTAGSVFGIAGDAWLVLLCGGLPFAFVAGVLLRGRLARTAATGTVVVLTVAGFVALAASTPTAAQERLGQAGRETLYVVSIPGYRPMDTSYGGHVGAGGFISEVPEVIPPQRWITIVASPRGAAVDEPGPCGETARGAGLDGAGCTAEPDGWIYRRDGSEHGYQVTSGELLVVVAGPHAVDRQVLRAAAATVHSATPAELSALNAVGKEGIHMADVPGYIAHVRGEPPGVTMEPANVPPPQNLLIDLSTALTVDMCGGADCTTEPDGLVYRRTDGRHGYVVRHGRVNISVMGGLAVDRTLLRRAALDARPATDEEILGSMPPVPEQSFLERLRARLRG
ncbi:hypothetical protein [Dactylosporangium sp. NPDC005555]|uniref:hypothetical protein n=1 Tax=Dactylosporangium sp. NPDC005555 TaxID=3154889 RepID=UPI0033B79D38